MKSGGDVWGRYLCERCRRKWPIYVHWNGTVDLGNKCCAKCDNKLLVEQLRQCESCKSAVYPTDMTLEMTFAGKCPTCVGIQ